ncbi:transposase [Streptomyces sp. NPDC002755]|uniref:transposase n=1 Tax=Streptomyces sp. NPDC002884 TaxID=3154544 RepID=UPI003320493B
MAGKDISWSTNGLLVDLLVTPADVQDRDATRILLTRLHTDHPEILLVWADNGYGGEEFATWTQSTLGITVKVVSRPKDAKGFVLLPKLLWNQVCQVPSARGGDAPAAGLESAFTQSSLIELGLPSGVACFRLSSADVGG